MGRLTPWGKDHALGVMDEGAFPCSRAAEVLGVLVAMGRYRRPAEGWQLGPAGRWGSKCQMIWSSVFSSGTQIYLAWLEHMCLDVGSCCPLRWWLRPGGLPAHPPLRAGGSQDLPIPPLERLVLIFSPKGVEPEAGGRETPLKNC